MKEISELDQFEIFNWTSSIYSFIYVPYCLLRGYWENVVVSMAAGLKKVPLEMIVFQNSRDFLFDKQN